MSLSAFYKRLRLYHIKTGRYPSPSYVLWDCTRRCNLNCQHCGASKEHYDKELSTVEVKRFIDELAQMRVRTFAVTGGEPLLRDDLLEVLSYAGTLGINTGIATNGFLLDEPMAQSLSSAGVTSVQISIDGDRDIHNLIRRNAQSYDRAISAVRHCLRVGIKRVTIATVITETNLDSLPALLNSLLAAGVRYWKVIPLMPIGRADKSDLQIEASTLISLMDFIRQARKKIRIQIGENLPYLGKHDRKVRSMVTYCPVGLTACCLGVDGRIRGCPEMPDTEEFCEGSILETGFDAIWQRGFGKYREEHLKTEDQDCRKCSWWGRCRGGCWVMRIGDLHCIKQWLSL